MAFLTIIFNAPISRAHDNLDYCIVGYCTRKDKSAHHETRGQGEVV